MTLIDERELIVRLIEKYGSLLTFHQKTVSEQHYCYDLSLQELAEEHQVSRSAIADVLHQSVAKLREYDQKMRLLARDDKVADLLAELHEASPERREQLIETIKELLRNGI